MTFMRQHCLKCEFSSQSKHLTHFKYALLNALCNKCDQSINWNSADLCVPKRPMRPKGIRPNGSLSVNSGFYCWCGNFNKSHPEISLMSPYQWPFRLNRLMEQRQMRQLKSCKSSHLDCLPLLPAFFSFNFPVEKRNNIVLTTGRKTF